MRYGTVPGIDKPISRLVQGTVMIRSHSEAASFQLLDEVFALGCNTFDSAHIYAQGDCERTLGRWIHQRGLRDQVVILTKCAHHNEDRPRVTPFDITSDLYDSLARLQVDTIDLYLLHRDNPAVPVEPIVDILNEHLAAGRIRAFGGSNWSHHRIEAANAYAAQQGLTPFAVSSPHFSLAVQVKEPWENCISLTGAAQDEARAYYARTQMPLFTWSSLAGGFFSGRFTPDNLDTFTEYLDRLCAQSYCYPDNFARLARAQQFGAARGLTLAQVALAYVFGQPWNEFALVGVNNGAEFAANVTALEVDLTPAELAWLRDGAGAPPF